MKKYFVLLIFFSILCNLTYSQNLTELVSIDLENPDIMEEYPFHSIDYKINSKQSVGMFFSIYISDIIDKHIPKLNDDESKLIIVLIKNSEGKIYLTTLADFLKSNVKLPPVIIISESKIFAKDTIVVNDKKKKKTKNDNLNSKKEIIGALYKVFHLQIKKMSANEISKYFTRNSIIFPQDQTTFRWIENARIIKILKLEK